MSPSLSVQDDILSPADSMRVNFKGKHPFAVCEKFIDYLRDVMKISRKDIVETDLRWDITSDPRTFYGWWAGTRKEDNWTRTNIRIIAQGSQSSKDFRGDIRITIKGTITTGYQYSNFIQRSFWWFFNYMFYYNNRRRYFELAKDNINEIREAILRQFEIYKED